MRIKSDRDVLQLMFKYGSFLLILPKFDFVKAEIITSPSRKFCTIISTLLIACGYTMSMVGRFFTSYTFLQTTDAVLDFFTLFLLAITNITIVSDTLTKRTSWMEFLKFLLATNVSVTKKRFLLYLNLFLLLHTYYFLLLFFDNYVWLNSTERWFYKYYFFRAVQEYFCLLMVFFMVVINSMLRARFKFLNSDLLDSKNAKCEITTLLKWKRQKRIEHATEYYIILYKAVMLYNQIFSWQHFLIVSCAVFSILDNIEKALLFSTLKKDYLSISPLKFAVLVCAASVAMVSVMHRQYFWKCLNFVLFFRLKSWPLLLHAI